MDFEYVKVEYSPEMEEFRKEVQQWLHENVPPDIRAPHDEGGMGISEEHHYELYGWSAEFRRKLGAKRWLYPTMPVKYGGGGLTGDHAAVIREEIEKRRPPWMFSVDLILGPIIVWGTEEQKDKFLPGLYSGETLTMQAFTEPQGGSDLANIKSRAVKDGDDWIINGQKTFCGGVPGYTNLLFGPIMTDPDSPRHRNLGFFLIPANAPGVTLIPLRLLSGTHQNFVMLDNVRVPGDHLIGGDHQGWQVSQTVLEEEHGGAPSEAAGPSPDSDFGHLSAFVRSTNTARHPLGSEPLVQERVADVYIESRVTTLWRLRNFSMYRAREEMSYEGSRGAAFGKELGLRQAGRMRDVMGPYALLHHDDALAPREGSAERRQRSAVVSPHVAGATEVHKVIVARRLGMSRTQERPAPTAGLVGAV